jgi:hypothetical protein
MPFVPKSLSELPKRIKPPTREYDKEAAAAILAIVSTEGETATDGETYPDRASARKEASKAARLLAHVLPEGKAIKSRVYGINETGDDSAWSVWMIDAEAPAEAPAKAAK